MWQGQDKVWLRYIKDIIAADVYSAVLLASQLRDAKFIQGSFSSLEVIDLQKYKVIKDVRKIRAAIRERVHVPFIFIVGKN